MNLVKKYVPKDLDTFIGDKESLNEALAYTKSKFPVIVVGDPGIGKTSGGHVIANLLGYTVSLTNMSDERTSESFSRLSSSLQSNQFTPTLFILDEIDGVSNQEPLLNALKTAKNPVYMTANDKYKISASLKKFCKVIEMKPPSVVDVAKHIKKIAELENITDYSFDAISSDVRASITATFAKSSLYEKEQNDFDLTQEAFKNQKISNIDPIWLIDNVHEFYFGMDVYDTLKILQYMVETEDPIFISTLKKCDYGKAKYPNFLRRR
jgi:DNA polymerase III delta prime subunit